MKPLIESPPRSLMEVYKNLPQGTLAELIDNSLYMSPAPFYNHQKTLQHIFKMLDRLVAEAGLGEVLIAPFDVYLDEESNAVQPDIIVVLRENENIIDKKGHIHGVPDLLVEILSEGNKDHDLVRKKKLYERFGVKEYWVIDPETKAASIFSFSSGKYVMLFEGRSKFHSPVLNAGLDF
jgi:Uma2 family endonuclease